jgi:hypothetical protein
MTIYNTADPANAAQVAYASSCNAAEATRQQSDAAALATYTSGGSVANYTSSLKADAVTDARTRLAAAVVNGQPPNSALDTLFVARGTFF